MAMEAAKHSQEVQDTRRAVAQLEQRVADQRDWAALRAAYERDLNAVADAVGQANQGLLDATAQRLGIDDLAACDARVNLLRADRDKLVEAERRLGEDLTAARATSVEKQKALERQSVKLFPRRGPRLMATGKISYREPSTNNSVSKPSCGTLKGSWRCYRPRLTRHWPMPRRLRRSRRTPECR